MKKFFLYITQYKNTFKFLQDKLSPNQFYRSKQFLKINQKILFSQKVNFRSMYNTSIHIYIYTLNSKLPTWHQSFIACQLDASNFVHN